MATRKSSSNRTSAAPARRSKAPAPDAPTLPTPGAPSSDANQHKPADDYGISQERANIALHATWQIESILNAIIEFAKVELDVESSGYLLALSVRAHQLNGIVMSATGDDSYETLPLAPLWKLVNVDSVELADDGGATEVAHG